MAEPTVCQDCCQIVRVDVDGSVQPHSSDPSGERACDSSGLLTGRVAEIVAASATRARPVRQGSTRLSSAPVRTSAPAASRRLPAVDPDAMPAPKWLPQWKGGSLPSVVLPSDKWLGVWMPGYSKVTQAYRVEDLTRRNVTSAWSAEMECWTVSSQHFLTVADTLMRRHQTIMVGREYNPRESCTVSCKKAQGPLCTCSCRAKNHGGGQWMAGWSVADEFGSTVRDKPWHWLVASRA